MTLTDEEYCGFLCEDITEKQQEIINELAGLKKYNPEFCTVMVEKLTKMFDSVK